MNEKINFLYGTAWKEDFTETCVFNALKAGYRAIDTANQRKHYYEEGVGSALSRAFTELKLPRANIFLQSKFTYARGQDHRKPYDENSPFSEQVLQSFMSSLEHLRTDYLDSYILHGPSSDRGLTEIDWEVWKSMESLCDQGKVRFIGVSNVNFEQLVELYEGAKVKPLFVQNRCFAETRWDQQIRTFCLKKGIFYQGFSLLTANWRFLGGRILRPENRNTPQLVFPESKSEQNNLKLHKDIQTIVQKTGKNIQQIIFRFAQQVGMIPMTGTRSEEHLKSNLEIDSLTLDSSQIATVENIAFLV